MTRILVVDDERVVRDLVEAVLAGEGHEIGKAAGGEEALAWIEENGLPDVILLDLMMPQMNGWRFLDELHARGLRRHTRIVIVSALADEDTRHRGREAGIRALVAKPFDPDALVEAVNSALAEAPEELANKRERIGDLAALLTTLDSMSG